MVWLVCVHYGIYLTLTNDDEHVLSSTSLNCSSDVYPWKEHLMGIGFSGQVCRAGYFCMHLDSAVLIVLYSLYTQGFFYVYVIS